jgi:hypothetical protein
VSKKVSEPQIVAKERILESRRFRGFGNFQTPIHVATGGFQKPFRETASGFLILLNRQNLSLRTPEAYINVAKSVNSSIAVQRKFVLRFTTKQKKNLIT